MDIFFNWFNKYKMYLIVLIISFSFSVILFYINYTILKSEEPIKKEVIAKPEEEVVVNPLFFVDIKGEVNNPGVYEFSEGNIVDDAIKKAGGLTNKGTTKNINLAYLLKAEMVITILSKNDLKNKILNNQTCSSISFDISECIKNDSISIVNKETTESGKSNNININTGSLEELMTLSGIGESKAQSIIDYRNEFGLFKSTEELMNVSGIGNAAYEKIKDYITI